MKQKTIHTGIPQLNFHDFSIDFKAFCLKFGANSGHSVAELIVAPTRQQISLSNAGVSNNNT
jgi:hypothetical protein